MKLSKVALLLSVVCLSATVSSCSPKADQYFKASKFDYTSTYRDVRLNSYTAESYSEVYNDEYDTAHVINNVRALVVPVDFTDAKAENLPKGAEGSLQDLKDVIFGEPEDTSWHSLASYYESSSLGTCKITGDVTDWYHLNVSIKQFANGSAFGPNNEHNGQKSTYATQALSKAIQDDVKAQKGIFAGYDLADYDANKDGYVDSLIMIYSCSPHVRVAGQAIDDDLYWAFCWSRIGAWGQVGGREAISRYFWASYFTFYENGYTDDAGKYHDWTTQDIVNGDAELDAHTLIHEFGHVLGLPDYYVTDYNKSDYSGLGNLDMMDVNVGDHNSMSKAWYGWVEPYIATGNADITLRSTTDTGDFILIPANVNEKGKTEYRNTLLDQFIMIEFLTPTGVAVLDGIQKFAGSYPLYYNVAGIRITHVDARLGLWTYDNQGNTSFAGYTIQTSTSVSNSTVDFAADNTANRSAFKNFKLLEVLPSNGKMIKQVGSASSETLFQTGAIFGETVWDNFKFNDRSGGKTVDFNFTIEIGEIVGNESAQIKIRVK